ncbi:uncharacterized protein PAC_06064 [Phialocephala subalpina]|uniref:Cell cycle negative regulator roughex n=1 Tax=Phialocephala subalpina TaxID=576137 RepID=A0A1L7WTU0_9HELO|nr:uncharacterized protein PAC_06064 [Phialocephala subalpina]
MAPIRRYLRITKYSVLECRIYLDNPALAESWLLNYRNPILPRVIESVRPLVLPKLREEKERSKKGGKKKGVKDVVVEEDFEVSIFLTETSTRHSLLTKQKHFRDKGKQGLQSNSSKLTGATNDTAIEVEDAPVIRREDSEDVDLQDLPALEDEGSESDGLFVDEDSGLRRSKRPRATTNDSQPESSPGFEPLPKRMRDGQEEEESAEDEGDGGDDKKKMAMDTTYDGFAIYGRVLCLVVKRKDKKGKGPATPLGNSAMMEDWITSTQMPPPEDDGP